jgi:hypothetical protein
MEIGSGKGITFSLAPDRLAIGDIVVSTGAKIASTGPA